MLRVAVPVLLLVAFGLGAYQHFGGQAVAGTIARQAPTGPRLSTLSFGGEFSHPVYTRQELPLPRRMLM